MHLDHFFSAPLVDWLDMDGTFRYGDKQVLSMVYPITYRSSSAPEFDRPLTFLSLKVEFNFRNMIVCICKRVTDRQVNTAIIEGASTVEEVGRACKAGTGCGACTEQIQR